MPLVITFGETMLRLAPPGFERFLQSPQFIATFGGGEANVAVAVAQFGLAARYVTVLPANNPIADAFIGELRRFGVDTSQIVRGKGRMGIYFVESGANQRASQSRLRPREQRHRPRQTRRHRLATGVRRRRVVPYHRHHSRRSARAPRTSA